MLNQAIIEVTKEKLHELYLKNKGILLYAPEHDLHYANGVPYRFLEKQTGETK